MSNKPYNNTINQRHFVPAIREWSNSVYYFNKSNLRDVYSRDSMSNNIIKSYFKLTSKPSKITKSKRMRDLIRRSTTRQLFVSRSYIKQTNTKSLITIYLYDREQKRFNKNLFRLKSMLFNVLSKLNVSNNYTNKVNSYTNKVRSILTSSVKHVKNVKSLSKYNKMSKDTNMTSRQDINHRNYNNKLVSTMLGKTNILNIVFYYYFFKWTLLFTGLNINILNKGDYVVYNNNLITINSKSFIIYKNDNGTSALHTKNGINKTVTINSNYFKLFKLDKKLKVENISFINNVMYRYIYLYLSSIYGTNKVLFIKDRLYLLYLFYYNTFYKSYRNKFLMQQYYAIFNMYKLHINNIKIKELLPGLKLLLSDVYNKNIELNLVKLKYLHLNSDIFMEAISIKLRKKTSKLLKILKKSLRLVKIPKKIHIDNIKVIKPINIIDKFKGLSINNYTSDTTDKIDEVLSNIYSNKHIINEKCSLNSDIFNNIKYKWVTGIRLEAKGRLTRRYTASRSLFKFKYKGNLRNLDYMNVATTSVRNERDILQTPSLNMVRNQVKPNIQYTLNSSKKRIGAFGIKGWINNN